MDDMEDEVKRINKERKIFFILVPVFLLIALIGFSFAFFNYTRTGSTNVIKVGRISFITNNEETITLSNLFPIDPTDTNAMNDNTKVGTYSINIIGDTDYVDGIEYLVSAVDANIYTSTGKTVPISLSVTVEDLGTSNDNYFTARESKNANIYKKMVNNTLVGDQMLLVGYIKPNTTSGTAEGVNGSITIKAYLDKNKILISDTYDGSESDEMGTTNSMAEGKTVLTTNEWNGIKNNGISFKVRVEANEGIWINPTLEEIMRINNIGIDTENGVDFSKTSEQDGLNGEGTKGVYLRSGTENDTNPILYYRGAVDDNNVIFGGFCWKTVRTTETGGVKLIYNGQYTSERKSSVLVKDVDYMVISNTKMYDDYELVYDSTTNTWKNKDDSALYNNALTISFNAPGNYGIKYDLESGYIKIKKGDTVLLYYNQSDSSIFLLENINSNDEITIASYDDYSTVGKFQIVKIEDGMLNICKSDYTIIGTSKFVEDSQNLMMLPKDVGYMYGGNYVSMSDNWVSNARFANSFTWDGSKYTLIDDSVTSPDSTHHYSCNLDTESGVCTDLRYVYSNNVNGKYYIVLTNGDGVDDAIRKMQTNDYDSNAKAAIDEWYVQNMNIYTNKLEDTIWCNDRSFNSNNQWNANGGNLSSWILYGPYERSRDNNNTSLLKNHPSLACANKNDRFTVNNENGNGALTYPIGLLTSDELVLSGGIRGISNNSFYLNSSKTYIQDSRSFWTMSPETSGFYYYGYYEYVFVLDGSVIRTNLANSDIGLRPSISLKPGQLITKGNGTANDPYVIE